MIVEVDAGQTHARVRVAGAHRLQTVDGPGMAINLAQPSAVDLVAAALESAVRRLIGEGQAVVDDLRIGLSGFDVASGGERARSVAARVGACLGARRVTVSTDDVMWYRATLGSSAGVLVAVGTGTVVLAAREDGDWKRVDGYGSLLGDDGSGFDIGRAGLRSALMHWDGRGGSEALLTAATVRFGPPAGIPAAVYRLASPTTAVAAFAADVMGAAAAGDPVAAGIVTSAAEALARSCAAAATILPTDGEPPVIACQGGLFANTDTLWLRFQESLASAAQGMVPERRAADPLDGAPDAETVGRFPGLVVGWRAD